MSESKGDRGMVFEDDLSLYNPARRASQVLEHVLDEESKPVRPAEEVVGVAEARQSRPVIDHDTGRTMSRVLFVTSDQAVLEKNSSVQNSYLDLAGMFDEIHVLVLVNRQGKDNQVRLSDNVWVYSVHAKYWWQLPFKARNHAEVELVFSGTVRPDVVVGVDPYLAGLSAYWIAGSFARPVQIQVHEDFYSEAFLNTPRGKWNRRLARYVLRRVNSVRAGSDVLAQMLSKRFKKIVDVKTLPHFYNLSGIRAAEPSFDVHQKYKDYVFLAITHAPLTADSYLHNVFTALRPVLLNPRIGLIVVGSGPAKQLYEEKLKLLGLAKNVIFLTQLDDEASYFKTADLLVEVDTSKDSEERVLKAAAAGLPILAAKTEVRQELFKDGQSAFLCPADDVQCFSQKTTKFLNQSSLRIQFANLAAEVVKARVNEDPVSYYRAYRDSVEAIIEAVEPQDAETGTDNHVDDRQTTVTLGGLPASQA